MTYLQKANSNANCISSTPEGSFVVCNWPRVTGKRLQDTGELELDLLDW